MHVVAALGQTLFQRLAMNAIGVHTCYIPRLKRSLPKVGVAFIGYRKRRLFDHVSLLSCLLAGYAIIPPARRAADVRKIYNQETRTR